MAHFLNGRISAIRNGDHFANLLLLEELICKLGELLEQSLHKLACVNLLVRLESVPW